MLWYLGSCAISNTSFCLLFNLQTVNNDFHSDGGASKLSPYLRFGCLSPRTLYHSLSETYLKVCQCIFLCQCFLILFVMLFVVCSVAAMIFPKYIENTFVKLSGVVLEMHSKWHYKFVSVFELRTV